MATDPKLACENFLGALGRIPKVMESHEKEREKVSANKEIYTAIANGSWKKEDELRTLKGEAAELDRKIALTLAQPEEGKEETESVKKGEGLDEDDHSAGIKNGNYPVQDKEEDILSQNFRRRWRH